MPKYALLVFAHLARGVADRLDHVVHAPAHAAVVRIRIEHERVIPVPRDLAEQNLRCAWDLDVAVEVENIDLHIPRHGADELLDPVRLAGARRARDPYVVVGHRSLVPQYRAPVTGFLALPVVVADQD